MWIVSSLHRIWYAGDSKAVLCNLVIDRKEKLACITSELLFSVFATTLSIN